MGNHGNHGNNGNHGNDRGSATLFLVDSKLSFAFVLQKGGFLGIIIFENKIKMQSSYVVFITHGQEENL